MKSARLFPFFLFLFPFLAGLLQGCQSYTITQRNAFCDEEGNVIVVSYGKSERDHKSTFIAPATGEEVEFASPYVIEVRSGDEKIVAWQCQNLLKSGTMYQTNDGEWKVLLSGFVTTVYRRTDETPPRYREIYNGVMCETASVDAKKDDRWKDVTQTNSSREYRRPAPAKVRK